MRVSVGGRSGACASAGRLSVVAPKVSAVIPKNRIRNDAVGITAVRSESCSGLTRMDRLFSYWDMLSTSANVTESDGGRAKRLKRE